MKKSTIDKKTGKSKAGIITGNHKSDFLKQDLGKKSHLPVLGSDTESSGEESGGSTGTVKSGPQEKGIGEPPLQKLPKADKKLFKALSIIAAEASDNKTVAKQIDLMINEVAKMTPLILDATNEVSGLQGELKATHRTKGTGAIPSMAKVVRTVVPGEQDRQPCPMKPMEPVVVK
ncbi:hypothetical protein MRX96_022314 [Rhipicephalus microplus]